MTSSLTFTRPAWRAVTRSSSRALPREVGGLLLGYYTVGGPLVLAAPVVRDSRATRVRYRRDATAAKQILDEHVHRDQAGLTGYVGEWHSHPLPIGPSGTDIDAVRALAQAGRHDVALLVMALGPSGWVGHARNVTAEGDLHTIRVAVEGVAP